LAHTCRSLSGSHDDSMQSCVPSCISPEHNSRHLCSHIVRKHEQGCSIQAEDGKELAGLQHAMRMDAYSLCQVALPAEDVSRGAQPAVVLLSRSFSYLPDNSGLSQTCTASVVAYALPHPQCMFGLDESAQCFRPRPSRLADPACLMQSEPTIICCSPRSSFS
jgi:hypothetical protein